MAPTSPDSKRPESTDSIRFPRSARLKRKRLIKPLFGRDNPDTESITAGCVRLLFRFVPQAEVGSEAPVQLGFAVGRSLGNAVFRNRQKRLMRETARTNRQDLEGLRRGTEETLTVMFVLRHHPSDDDSLRRDVKEAMTGIRSVLQTRSETG